VGLDVALFRAARAREDVVRGDELELDGVAFKLPRARARGRWRRHDWQRKVMEELLPDSVDADAPERTPASILSQLTGQQATVRDMQGVLQELPPLEPLFLAETHRRRGKLPIAFHVLAVKGASRRSLETKGFTYRTFALLCRDRDGQLDEPLVEALVNEFRRAPDELDLAQRTVLEALYPGWEPSREPSFDPSPIRRGPAPLDYRAADLFRADLRTLLDARLPPADFFQYLNQLLILHLGLYLPRIASFLTPRMRALGMALAGDVPGAARCLEGLESDYARRHPFAGALPFRAPDAGEMRAVSLDDPARLAYLEQTDALSRLHFDLLMLVRVRGLASAYLARQWDWGPLYSDGSLGEDDAALLAERVRGPTELVQRMADDAAFAEFLGRGLTMLAARYVETQISEVGRERARRAVEGAPSSYAAMRALYERYNRQSGKVSSSRAYRQGAQVMSQILRQGEYGLAQSRQRVGGWYEVGAGILPLLVLLAVGSGRDKVPLTQLFGRLEAYGMSLAPAERARVLERLVAMGVYERYSDAGDAAFVRNLLAVERDE